MGKKAESKAFCGVRKYGILPEEIGKVAKTQTPT